MRKALFLSALFFTTGALAMPVPGSLVQRVQIATGLSTPVGVTHAGDGSGRLFIVEQTGRIRVWDGTAVLSTPFLDLTGQVGPCNGTDCGERGLLGLAFHPQYPVDPHFFVYYTRASDGDIVLARYLVSANPNVANAASGQILLTIEHSSAGNHNGGQIAFGPDGYLYIGTGDGGGGGDPFENGQNLNSLLGKILRIDVDGGTPYAIPASNPFAGARAGADEIWAYGLRNPWRFSFDRATGDLYIGDVGQSTFEEIDFQAAASAGGENYGWDCREGFDVYDDQNDVVNMPPIFNSNCAGRTFRDPILGYGRSFGDCSVTGGFVYRGLAQSSLLTGNYLYGDLCSGRIWRGIRGAGGTWTSQEILVTGFGLTSFGESENGRLYLTYLGGTLHWLSPYTFADVPPSNGFWPFVEALAASGLTAGCAAGPPPSYCPGEVVNRAEMAIFLLRGREGTGYTPPPATGTVFADVPAGSFAAEWIEQLHRDGLTAGCAAGSPPRYCPASGVQRAEMAVFLLRAKYGSTFTPPPARGVFSDVPTSHWAAPWIERLYDEGITAGCGTAPLRYCPTDPVTRGEMAAFLSRTFNLPLP